MIILKIVTPERILLEKEVDAVTLPTENGEITVMSHHIPLLSNLVAGEVRYRMGGKEESFVTGRGTIEVSKNNQVTLLAETAEHAGEIDSKRAEMAKERAQKLMQENYKDEKLYAEAAASLERHLARLKVARKHRTKTHKNLESGVLPQ